MNVVVVDDERIVREGIASICRQSGLGLHVWEAGSSREALRLIAEHHADIVLLDIRMPDTDGLQLLEQIRDLHIDPVCIIVSGYEDFSIARLAIRYGVMDYLLKPAGIKDILYALQKAVTKAAAHKPKSLVSVSPGAGPEQEPFDTQRLNPLQVAQDYIQSNIHKRITLTDVSAKAHVTPTYLAALFKQKMKQTFLEYVTSRKMEVACLLLKKGYQSQQVAEHLGYEDPKYFGQLFKKVIGQTPSQYRADWWV